MQYCSLQHWTLLLSPVTFTTGYCFFFCSIPSFFLELFLHWSPVAYWAPTDLGSSSFSILPFCTVHGALKARILKWFAIPFSSGPHSVRHLHHDLTILGDSTQHGLVSLSSTRLWSCDHIGYFSVIMVLVSLPSDARARPYCLTWVSLTLDVGYAFTAGPAKCSHCSLPWTRGIFSQPPLLTWNVE